MELARSAYVLSAHRAKGAMEVAANFLERRALHFSTAEGHDSFRERLARGKERPSPMWMPVFDGEIPGPWSRWSTVWRCAVAMPTDEFLDSRSNFFFW